MFPLTRFLRATAVVCALAGLSAPVAAATYDVVKQRARLTDDGTGLKQVRGLIDMPVNGKQKQVLVRAGSYHLKKRVAGSSDAYEDFIAFSVDAISPVEMNGSAPVVFQETNSLFDPRRRALMATLLANAFDPAADAQHHAAIQLAIWKIAYGDVDTPTDEGFDVKRKSFEAFSDGYLQFMKKKGKIVLNDSFDKQSPGLFGLTNSYLRKLDGIGGDDWKLVSGRGLTFLRSAGRQDLVTYTPAAVPLPAGGVLLATGLGALVIRRRRRT